MDERKSLFSELLKLPPSDMLIDPRFTALDDDSRAELFYTIAPPDKPLRIRDERYPEVLRALKKFKFKWHGAKHIRRLSKLKSRAEQDEIAHGKFKTELLLSKAYLAALSDKYD